MTISKRLRASRLTEVAELWSTRVIAGPEDSTKVEPPGAARRIGLGFYLIDIVARRARANRILWQVAEMDGGLAQWSKT